MNFFKIRLPHTAEVIEGCAQRILLNVEKPALPGFIYSTFEEYPHIFQIPIDSETYTDQEADKWALRNDEAIGEFQNPSDYIFTRDYYLTLVTKLKSITQEWDQSMDPSSESHSKIIASRISREKCDITPAQLFDKLCRVYPSACVFLFSTASHGTWIGASPEPILQYSERMVSSLSLAGTRWGDETKGNSRWSKKNIEEQVIVTDFISAAFRKFNLNPTIHGPHTLKAGPVQHLATDISSEGEIDNFKLLSYLCPTPALSGFPRQEAIRAISELESQPRQCYGGLIGIVGDKGQFSAFANLRSGQFHSDKGYIDLRAGGGITHLSDPETEWEETEKKLRTIRNFLSKKEDKR